MSANMSGYGNPASPPPPLLPRLYPFTLFPTKSIWTFLEWQILSILLSRGSLLGRVGQAGVDEAFQREATMLRWRSLSSVLGAVTVPCWDLSPSVLTCCDTCHA